MGFFSSCFAVNVFGYFVSEDFFCLVDFCAFQAGETFYFIHWDKGEEAQAVAYILIVDIAPVLVEIVWAHFIRVKPYSTVRGLTHFLAFTVGEELKGETEGFSLVCTTYQFYPTDDVAPLVVATEFELAIIVAIEVQEVVGLHDHVVEFQEGQALFHAGLVAFSVDHTVNAEVSAVVTQEFDVVEVSEPVGIVQDEGLIVREIDEACGLFFETLHVVVDLFHGHDATHIATTGWVADHAGATTCQEDWTVTMLLHVLHNHELNIVAHMQTVCGWVKANIERNFFLS